MLPQRDDNDQILNEGPKDPDRFNLHTKHIFALRAETEFTRPIEVKPNQQDFGHLYLYLQYVAQPQRSIQHEMPVALRKELVQTTYAHIPNRTHNYDDEDRLRLTAPNLPYSGLLADEQCFLRVSDYFTFSEYARASRLNRHQLTLARNNYPYYFTRFKSLSMAHALIPQGDFSLNLSTLQRWTKSLYLQQSISYRVILQAMSSDQLKFFYSDMKQSQENMGEMRSREISCGLCEANVSIGYHLDHQNIQMACPCCRKTRLWTTEEVTAVWGFNITDLENVPCWSRDRKHYSTADLLEAWRHNTMLDEKTSQHPRFKDLPLLVRLSYAYQHTKPTPPKDAESKDSESKASSESNDPAVYEFLFNFSQTLPSAIQLDPTKLIPILLAELDKKPDLKSKFAHDYFRNEIQAIYRTVAFYKREADRKLGRLEETLGDRKKELVLLNYDWGTVKSDVKDAKTEQTTQEFHYWAKLPRVLQQYVVRFIKLNDATALCKSMALHSNSIYESLFREWFPTKYQNRVDSSLKNKTDFKKEFKQQYMSTIAKQYLIREIKSNPTHTKWLRLFKENDLPKIIQENITISDLFNITDGECYSLFSYITNRQSILNYYYVKMLDKFSQIENADIHSELPEFWKTTLLYWAASFNQVDTVKKLLELDEIVIDAENSDKETPLWIAATRGHEEIVKLLLDKNASVDSTNFEGYSALYNSIGYGFFSIAKTLIEHKADVNKSSDAKNSPIHAARTAGMTKLLLENKAIVNAPNFTGRTPLSRSITRNDLKTVELLLEAKAEVDYVIDKESTPLNLAASLGNVKMVKALLDARACPVSIEGSLQPYSSTTNPGIRKLLLLAELDMQIRGGFSDRAVLEKLKNCLQANNLEAIEQIKTSSIIVNDFCACITETVSALSQQPSAPRPERK